MNIPTSKKETLDRMRKIVSADSFDNRDTQSIRDLIDLANHSEIREGMGKRRRQLEHHLETIARLSQRSAIDKHWVEIHSLVSDFSSEIACANSTP